MGVRVLLAGGGSAGHTSPLIATADAVRRLAPEAQIVCLGTSRGLETRVIPEAGYRLELIPPSPCPGGWAAISCASPPGCGRPCGPPERCSSVWSPTSSSGSGATSRCPPTSRPAAWGCPWWSTRATPGPDSRTASVPGSAPIAWRRPSRTLRCRTRRSPACPSAGRSPRWTAPRSGRWPVPTSVWTRRCPRCW